MLLYYLRARYYDPTTAQFLSRDPAVSVTRSPYGYVGGNPLNAVDPSGRDYCNVNPVQGCISTPDLSQCAGGAWDGQFAVVNPGSGCLQGLREIGRNVDQCLSIDDCGTAIAEYVTELEHFSSGGGTPSDSFNSVALGCLQSQIADVNLKGQQLNLALVEEGQAHDWHTAANAARGFWLDIAQESANEAMNTTEPSEYVAWQVLTVGSVAEAGISTVLSYLPSVP